jgi:hypothetical protein
MLKPIKKELTELPTCPVCIEKLDCSITGIYYESIAKLFIYEELKRFAIDRVFSYKKKMKKIEIIFKRN